MQIRNTILNHHIYGGMFQVSTYFWPCVVTQSQTGTHFRGGDWRLLHQKTSLRLNSGSFLRGFRPVMVCIHHVLRDLKGTWLRSYREGGCITTRWQEQSMRPEMMLEIFSPLKLLCDDDVNILISACLRALRASSHSTLFIHSCCYMWVEIKYFSGVVLKKAACYWARDSTQQPSCFSTIGPSNLICAAS